MKRPADHVAMTLGVVRFIVHGYFLVTVLTVSFDALGRLPVTIMRPVGIMQYFPWSFYDQLVTPKGMMLFKCLLVLSLLCSTFGYRTWLTTKTSMLLVIVYQGLLRSFGHFNHDEMVAIYALIILSLTPCGDRFSLDALRRSASEKPRWAYTYPVLLMQIIMAWVYCTAGLLKLRVSGLGYFHPDNFITHAFHHSLDNLHDTQFHTMYWMPALRAFMPVVLALAVGWEILFPLVFVRRLRWWILGSGVCFHLSTMVLLNIMFWSQLTMYLVFVDWAACIHWLKEQSLYSKRSARGATAAETHQSEHSPVASGVE